jgi:small conductance mechanosensitive channel
MDWLLTNGLRLVFLILIGCVAVFLIRVIAKKAIQRAAIRHGGANDGEAKRVKTLTGVVTRTIVIGIVAAVGMMVLSEFGLNIGPLIAGAGIIGLAVSFGAQSLVKDCLAGLFILLENQYSVGDRIRLNDLYGEVTDITLRRTVVRDDTGALHSIPNGEIDRTANFSKTNAHIHIDLPVSYDADVERIIAIMNRVGEDLSGEAEMKKVMRKPFAFFRIESFGESTMVLRACGDSVSTGRAVAAGAYRLRLLKALKEEGIKIK